MQRTTYCVTWQTVVVAANAAEAAQRARNQVTCDGEQFLVEDVRTEKQTLVVLQEE